MLRVATRRVSAPRSASAALGARRHDHSHSHSHARDGPPDVTIRWYFKKTGEEVIVGAYFGENLLRLAQRHDIPLEGAHATVASVRSFARDRPVGRSTALEAGAPAAGACEGVTACSTCHCILDDDFFDELEYPEEREEDMLDQAFGLTPTSRLACQLKVDERFDGVRITLPEATRNFYVDGHVPQPH